MTKRWLRERQKDHYYRLAKKEGYRSRAAYKLLQASGKYRFIRKGDIVVDLGAAPGGWMQAARRIVGDPGYVLGVDVEPIDRFKWENVASLIGDIHALKGSDIIGELPRKCDVLISDASPNISGIWEVDHARQIDLAEASLMLALSTLRTGGSVFIKVFQGDLLKAFIEKVKSTFRLVRIVKPDASRKKSSERYILALRLWGKD